MKANIRLPFGTSRWRLLVCLSQRDPRGWRLCDTDNANPDSAKPSFFPFRQVFFSCRRKWHAGHFDPTISFFYRWHVPRRFLVLLPKEEKRVIRVHCREKKLEKSDCGCRLEGGVGRGLGVKGHLMRHGAGQALLAIGLQGDNAGDDGSDQHCGRADTRRSGNDRRCLVHR